MKQVGSVKESLSLSKDHYENFPVVSFLVPKHMRKDVAVIYWFARTADDFADEGNLLPEERLIKLNDFENRLTSLLKGYFENDVESALHKTIKERNLTPKYFYDLLKAFKQDVVKKSYRNFEELLDYCNYSANPVGRLILELNNIRSDEAFNYSDKICSALQLTNFYQDIKIDYLKGRIYLPEDEMAGFVIEKKVFELNENNLNLKKLLRFNVARTKKMFEEGRGLLKFLNGRLKYEIKWTILGGEEILKKIVRNDYRVLEERPKLNKFDFVKLFLIALYD
ncbi:MAG: squalene synthase HpnC [Ignavibacteriaceae bacterium]